MNQDPAGPDRAGSDGAHPPAAGDGPVHSDGRPTTRLRSLIDGARPRFPELAAADEYQLLRIGSNHVFADAGGRTVLRVGRASQAEDVRDNLHTVRALSEHGAPVIAPLSTEPLVDECFVVSVWPRAAPVVDHPFEHLGRALASLHAVRAPVLSTPVDFVGRIRHRWDALPDGLPHRLRTVLSERARAALDAGRTLREHDGVPVHGDAHPGNLVLDADGRAALIDLDDLALGPREVDLAPALVSYRRFHRDDGVWEGFLSGFGADGVDDACAELLVTIRETTMNLWLAGLWDSVPRSRDELSHRIATWDEDWREHPPWNAL